jgi:Glycogen recognition site of AMP-activated protein kinase
MNGQKIFIGFLGALLVFLAVILTKNIRPLFTAGGDFSISKIFEKPKNTKTFYSPIIIAKQTAKGKEIKPEPKATPLQPPKETPKPEPKPVVKSETKAEPKTSEKTKEEKPRTQRVTFRYENDSANKVEISGTFSSWEKKPLKKTKDGWRADLYMFPGKYHYYFIVDGIEISDPKNPPPDNSNHSIIMVEKD